MPRDGNGLYTLVGTPLIDGAVAEATGAPTALQPKLDDIADALTDSLAADGQTPWAGHQDASGFKLTALAAAAVPGDAVRYEQLTALASVYQPIDPQLSAWAELTPEAGQMFYWQDVDTLAAIPTTAAAGRSTLQLADPGGHRLVGWNDATNLMAFFTAPAAGLAFGAGTISLANDLAALEGLGGTGLAVRTGLDAWAERAIDVGTGLSINNANGAGGNPTISLDADLAAIAALTTTAAGRSILTFVDPNADRIFGWDDSAGSAIGFTLGTGLAFNGTAIELDADLVAIAGITTAAAGRSVLTLTDPNADRIVFWDDSAGAMAHLAAGDGLSLSGTTIAVTADVLRDADVGVSVQAFDADLAAIAALTTTTAGRSILTFADPNADRIFGWDDSAGSAIGFALGTGLAFNGAAIELDADLVALAGLATQAAGRSVLTLTDPNIDRFLVWDDSAGAMAYAAIGTGLTLSATPAVSVDFAAVQAQSSKLSNLAASSAVSGTITVSTSAPSGGADGDLWLQREA